MTIQTYWFPGVPAVWFPIKSAEIGEGREVEKVTFGMMTLTGRGTTNGVIVPNQTNPAMDRPRKRNQQREKHVVKP
jgi:hypothetical protein